MGARRAEIEHLAKVRERKALISAFLKKHGYNSVSAPKRTMLKTKYPIHTAAKSGDPQIVTALLQEGLDLTQKDSSGHTALQIAKAKNKNGSHDSVLRALGGA